MMLACRCIWSSICNLNYLDRYLPTYVLYSDCLKNAYEIVYGHL